MASIVGSFVVQENTTVEMNIIKLNAHIAKIVIKQNKLCTAIDKIVTDLEGGTLLMKNKKVKLDENSVSSILEHTASGSKTYQTQFYILEAIIYIGYRIKSHVATKFRIWATKRLREYIPKGFMIRHSHCGLDPQSPQERRTAA